MVEAVWCVWEPSGISSTSSRRKSCLALASTRHLLDLPIRGLFQKTVSLVDQYGRGMQAAGCLNLEWEAL